MFGYYTPVLLLQAFCLYHAYKNNTQQMWYWIIIFFPVGGCLIYLYNSFYNRNNIRNLAEGIKGVVNSNYRIEQLEKELRFADTVTNKTRLADAYVAIGRYQDAVGLYSDCLKGFMADDPALRMKFLQACYFIQDYESTVQCGMQLETEKTFRNAEERIAYAWALYRQGNVDQARLTFEDMDRSFTNYTHRLEYCKFLLEIKESDRSKEKLAELLSEFEYMNSMERKLKRNIMKDIRSLYDSLNAR